ncbi:MAG: SPASM domain-containing protein, partial [Symbiobacteriaceae bacterium]|nr:SPASM domain-containing protein [Symbiobacteriaceae bacterium]
AYCFAKGGNFGDEQLPSIMSSGVGRQAVDLLFNNCGQNNNRLYIAFFGGEPLINWALVKELTCYAEEKASSAGKNVSFSMTTNACLVDDEMVDFISSHKIDIMVSLDGEEHIHDKLRPHKSESTSSYEKTLAGVKALRAKINNISGNATITVINNDLEEVYSHLTEIGFTRIGMDMVSGSADKSLEFDHLHLSMHTQELVGLIVDGKVPLLANAPRLDERRSNRLYYCGFSRGSVTVDSIGRLYSCPRLVCVEKYQVGHVDAGYDSKKIQHLRSSIMIDNKLGCRTCWLRYLCGGGCPAESEESQGGIGSPYSQGCYRYQHLLEASVENYLISIRSNS